MHDLRLPLWGAGLLTIFLFCVGMWQIALFNIVLLVVQILGSVLFDWEPKLTAFLYYRKNQFLKIAKEKRFKIFRQHNKAYEVCY